MHFVRGPREGCVCLKEAIVRSRPTQTFATIDFALLDYRKQRLEKAFDTFRHRRFSISPNAFLAEINSCLFSGGYGRSAGGRIGLGITRAFVAAGTTTTGFVLSPRRQQYCSHLKRNALFV
jgi:hypothetical protein